MSEFKVDEKLFKVDENGFLQNPDDWDKDFASEMAKQEGINELTESHWKVIDFMRKEFKENGKSPTVRRISKQSGVNTKEFYKSFPGGPGKKAAKIAGVPKPVGCV
jgi:TusE/DsrC/DsvC family sulfur relay protein